MSQSYRPPLRALRWPVVLFIFFALGALLLPDLNRWTRLLGAPLLLASVLIYVTLIVRLRVEVGDKCVRVRRFFRWRTYTPGDRVGVETFQPAWGSPSSNVLLDSTESGRSRVPTFVFRQADSSEIVRGIESVLGTADRRTPRKRRRT